MAPRLKILMFSGSKKGTQIYYLFYPKSPGKQIPSRFSNGALMERDTRLQGIFLYLLIYIYLFLRPYENSVPPCSPKVGPLWKQTSMPEPYLTYLSGPPVKEPSPEALCTEPLQRERDDPF
jgi:hypothetical protein